MKRSKFIVEIEHTVVSNRGVQQCEIFCPRDAISLRSYLWGQKKGDIAYINIYNSRGRYLFSIDSNSTVGVRVSYLVTKPLSMETPA